MSSDEGDLGPVEAEILWRVRQFDEMMQWPKPVQKPHPPITSAEDCRTARAAPLPTATAGCRSAAVAVYARHAAEFREMLRDAGGARRRCRSQLFGVGMNGDALKRARDAGVDRVVFGVPAEARDKVLPLLDKGAALIQ